MFALTSKRWLSSKTSRLIRELLLEKYRTINSIVPLLPDHLVFYRHACSSIFSKKLATFEALLSEPDDKKIAAVLLGDETLHVDAALNSCLEEALKEVEEEIKLIESMTEKQL